MSDPPAGAAGDASSSYAPLPSLYNDGGAREFLMACKWPVALQETFIANMARTPLRYFICDDSGSMGILDGQKLVTDASSSSCSFVSCSRFQELSNALQFHIGFARAACAPTEFRFLNGNKFLKPVRVGFAPPQCSEEHFEDFLYKVIHGTPSGDTPLCRHIHEIVQDITSHAAQLRTTGQRACVIIATDGESSDGDIVEALRPLKDLPVSIVIRLCTNEESIASYWNNIDDQLELNMDVIDDHRGEAEEIRKKNPYIVYGEPLHRMREFGVSLKEFDLLDEKLIPLGSLPNIAKIFYGDLVCSFPRPEDDLNGFLAALEKEIVGQQVVSCPFTMNPLTLKASPWIDTKAVHRTYGKGCVVL